MKHTRELFDKQILAQCAGHLVLEYRDTPNAGDRLGFAKVRLPNIADTDLFVSLHDKDGKSWVEPAPDTPPQFLDPLRDTLQLFHKLIVSVMVAQMWSFEM